MRKVEFAYLEVLNETEQLMIFTTQFNGQDFGEYVTLNTALSPAAQDKKLIKAIDALQNMKRKDAKDAKKGFE